MEMISKAGSETRPKKGGAESETADWLLVFEAPAIEAGVATDEG